MLLVARQLFRIRTGRQSPSHFNSFAKDVKVVRGSQVCAGTVRPARRDNANPAVKMASERECFDVKAPAIDLANREDLFGGGLAERFKPTLSVPDPGHSHCLDKKIACSTQDSLRARLRSFMQRSSYVAGMTRANDEVITIAEKRRQRMCEQIAVRTRFFDDLFTGAAAAGI